MCVLPEDRECVVPLRGSGAESGHPEPGLATSKRRGRRCAPPLGLRCDRRSQGAPEGSPDADVVPAADRDVAELSGHALPRDGPAAARRAHGPSGCKAAPRGVIGECAVGSTVRMFWPGSVFAGSGSWVRRKFFGSQ